MAELLFEVGTEELPARFVGPALDDLERGFRRGCEACGLPFGALRRFGTPRRLALLVDGVVERTADAVKEVVGPPVRAAFDAAGQAKVPALKFAESVGRRVDELERVQTPKGEYLAARVVEPGRRAVDLLPEILTGALRGLGFPKSMRWGDVDVAFGRPLHWLVALLDEQSIPLVFADVRSGRSTRGHRFMAAGPVELRRAGDYEAALERASVIAEPVRRRTLLVERLKAAAASAGGALVDDDALVDQVTNLVELPCPVVGTFEARHLDLPPEVLVQEMKGHQRYFPVVGPDGKLLPSFIAVSNTEVRDVALSRRGYERVLRARLSDGRFFFDEDRRTRLADRLPRLERVVWNRDLGSTYAQKVERVRALALWLARAQRVRPATPELLAAVDRAALLAKADLVTGMVGEFPELQGVMGREYALHDGESPEVAKAVFEHYLPRGAGDALPSDDVGALVGIADRLDTLVAIFAAGKRPTGAADPFGLRRACLGTVHVTLARGYRFSLASCLDEAWRLLREQLPVVGARFDAGALTAQVLDFFRGRLEALWREQHRPDVVDAVLSASGGFGDLVETSERLKALAAAVGTPEFPALAATFKRVANLVEKQGRDVAQGGIDPARLVDPAELQLFEALRGVQGLAREAVAARDFVRTLAVVGSLRGAVDTFFERVMVMSDDAALRENRVRLLTEIAALFGNVADFARLRLEP